MRQLDDLTGLVAFFLIGYTLLYIMAQHIGKWKIAFLVLLVVGSVFVVINDRQQCGYVTDTGKVFGTTYRITYSHPVSLKADIEKCLARVDSSLSPFNKSSVITAVNRNCSVVVDSMFCDVFALADEVSKQTGGAFDITVAPLVNAWGFGFERSARVDSFAIDSIRRFVGFRKVMLDSLHRIKKTDPRVMLDCSAIAKGYACDMVAYLLYGKGVENYMIEIGGEIVVKGKNAERKDWNIGISKPVEDSVDVDNGIQSVLALADCAVATSGNYRRFYYKNGRRYSHTIDPRTGYPVKHTMLSSTVIARDCATADAFATAFMVLGPDSAKIVLRSRPDLLALFISSDEEGKTQVWMSPGLKSKVNDK